MRSVVNFSFLGRLKSDLIKNLLHKLNESLKDVEASGKNLDPDKVLRIIKALENLLPFVLVFCVKNESVLNRIDKDMAMELSMINFDMSTLHDFQVAFFRTRTAETMQQRNESKVFLQVRFQRRNDALRIRQTDGGAPQNNLARARLDNRHSVSILTD